MARRTTLALLAAAAISSACGSPQSTGATPTATPTAATSTSAAPATTCSGQSTPAVTEGPYFKAGSPARTSLLAAGMSGTRLYLTGRVLTTGCAPVAGARLDFWQADASGAYDNSGYRLRGNQTTKADGSYTLETVVPGLYPGRTEHIHVKVQAPNKPVLTTQLFFPGVSRNQQDGIFNNRLLITVQSTADGVQGSFDFVVGG
jgi:protocatechuate 3,4-dioxygenase beta subunit